MRDTRAPNPIVNNTCSSKTSSSLLVTFESFQVKMFDEIEDIMCDQRIISQELNDELESRASYIIGPPTRLRVAVALFTRTLMPGVLKLYYLCLRNQQVVVDSLRHRLLPAVVAFVVNSISSSLASVQKHIPSSSSRKAIKNISEDIGATANASDDASATPEPSVICEVLAAPSGPVLADVIFIHGLHGGVDKTWKQGTWRHDGHKLRDQMPRRRSTGDLYVPTRSQKRSLGALYRAPKVARREETCVTREADGWEVVEEVGDEEGYSGCWPRDWLPKDCPGVRVIALNYSTDVLWCPVWKKKRIRTDMVERSDEMINELVSLGVGRQPLIWVGHSKGGLFVKQILLNAFEKHRSDPEIAKIYQNTKGIMFYSVPHKGSSLADFTLPLLRRSVELIEIQRNCRFVLDQHRRFLELCKKGHLEADIFSFIETSFTLMTCVYLKIVAYESADPEIGVKCDVPLDHREICKPAGRDCFLYLELVKVIRKYMLESS